MATTFDIAVVFKLVDRLSKPAKKLNSAFNTVGKKMQDVGKNLTAKVTLPLVGLGTVAVKSSMDFNKGMANVASLLTDLGKEGGLKRVRELKEQVKALGKETGTPLNDLSNGLYQTVSAFGDGEDTMARLTIANKAAKAGLSSTTEALELLSAVTKGYDDTTAQATQKAADLAFQTVKLGQTTFPELASSIGRVVPLASKLGMSQEELFAGFSTLTGVTGNAAEVSTQMAAIMRAMLKPTDFLQKAVKALGYESASTMLTEEGLVGTLQKLMDLTQGNDQAAAALFGRAEALTSVFALTGAQADDYRKKLKANKEATGAMNKAYDAQTKGINKTGHSWDRMKVKVSATVTELGDRLLPVVEKLIRFVDKLIDKWDNLSDSTKDFIIKIAGIAAAVGPLLFIFGGIIGSISKFISIIKIAVAVMGMLGTSMLPVLITIGAIVAVIAAAILIWKNWDKIVEFSAKLWVKFKDGMQKLWKSLKEQPLIKSIIIWVGLAKKAWSGLTSYLGEAWNNISTKISEKWIELSAGWEKFTSKLPKDMNKAKSKIASVWNSLTNKLTRTWVETQGKIQKKMGELHEFFGAGDPKKGLENTLNFLDKKIVELGTTIKSKMTEAWSGVTSWLTVEWNSTWDKLTGGVSRVWESTKEIFDNLKNSFSNFTNDLKTNPFTRWLFGDKKNVGSGKEKTEIDINLRAEPGTSATITNVRGTKESKVKARTGSVLGSTTGKRNY